MRELAPEAGVSHQALSAFFKRPEVVAKMRSLERLEHSAEAQRSTSREAGRRAPAATAARATPRPEPERRRERPAGKRQPMRLGFLASEQTPPEHVNADGTVNLSKSAAARSGWNPPYNSPPPDWISAGRTVRHTWSIAATSSRSSHSATNSSDPHVAGPVQLALGRQTSAAEPKGARFAGASRVALPAKCDT